MIKSIMLICYEEYFIKQERHGKPIADNNFNTRLGSRDIYGAYKIYNKRER